MHHLPLVFHYPLKLFYISQSSYLEFAHCSFQSSFNSKPLLKISAFLLDTLSPPASMKTDQPVLSKIIIDKKSFLICGVQEWFCHLFHLIITALLIRGSNRELLFYFQTRKTCPMTTVKKNAIGCFSIK